MKWRKIDKDKDGFLTSKGSSDMYHHLPIVVVNEYDEGMYPDVEYVDKENWYDSVSDFSKEGYKWWMPVDTLPLKRDWDYD